MRLGNACREPTRIEVMTEGVFARMILADPELEGVAAVLFDEFHERSLDADLGLALALDVQSVLRDDLRIVVMSATLDRHPISPCSTTPRSSRAGTRLSGQTSISRPRPRGRSKTR